MDVVDTISRRDEDESLALLGEADFVVVGRKGREGGPVEKAFAVWLSPTRTIPPSRNIVECLFIFKN